MASGGGGGVCLLKCRQEQKVMRARRQKEEKGVREWKGVMEGKRAFSFFAHFEVSTDITVNSLMLKLN